MDSSRPLKQDRSALLQSTRFHAGIGLMKHLNLIVLLTIGVASTALAQSEKKVEPSQTSVERQLVELERQLSDALSRIPNGFTFNRRGC